MHTAHSSPGYPALVGGSVLLGLDSALDATGTAEVPAEGAVLATTDRGVGPAVTACEPGVANVGDPLLKINLRRW